MKRIFLAASLIAGIALAVSAAPAQAVSSPAADLPHDAHDGLTVSADIYVSAARAREKFGKASPSPVGILPVEVFFRNDTSLPVKLNMDTIQLEVHNGTQHQDLDWMDPVEVATNVAHPNGPANPHTRRFPLGLNIPKDEKRDKVLEQLKPFTLDADIIPPHGAIHGFLFFNVGRDVPALSDTSLYVPDLAVAGTNTPFMFFEVMLAKPTAGQHQ